MSNMNVQVEQAALAPFYLVFDVSASMMGEMDALNQALRDLKNEMLKSPILADIARVSLISFSDAARVVIPMMDLAQDTLIGNGDVLHVEGMTSYMAAFRTLKDQIQRDIPALKAESGGAVYRPMVFFVTDGYPNDLPGEWERAFKELTTAQPFPNVIPFGFGEANAEILKEITFPKKRGESFYFIARQGLGRADAMAAIAKIVVQSVVSSTQSAVDGMPRVNLEKAGTEHVLQQAPAWDMV